MSPHPHRALESGAATTFGPKVKNRSTCRLVTVRSPTRRSTPAKRSPPKHDISSAAAPAPVFQSKLTATSGAQKPVATAAARPGARTTRCYSDGLAESSENIEDTMEDSEPLKAADPINVTLAAASTTSAMVDEQQHDVYKRHAADGVVPEETSPSASEDLANRSAGFVSAAAVVPAVTLPDADTTAVADVPRMSEVHVATVASTSVTVDQKTAGKRRRLEGPIHVDARPAEAPTALRKAAAGQTVTLMQKPSARADMAVVVRRAQADSVYPHPTDRSLTTVVVREQRADRRDQNLQGRPSTATTLATKPATPPTTWSALQTKFRRPVPPPQSETGLDEPAEDCHTDGLQQSQYVNRPEMPQNPKKLQACARASSSAAADDTVGKVNAGLAVPARNGLPSPISPHSDTAWTAPLASAAADCANISPSQEYGLLSTQSQPSSGGYSQQYSDIDHSDLSPPFEHDATDPADDASGEFQQGHHMDHSQTAGSPREPVSSRVIPPPLHARPVFPPVRPAAPSDDTVEDAAGRVGFTSAVAPTAVAASIGASTKPPTGTQVFSPPAMSVMHGRMHGGAAQGAPRARGTCPMHGLAADVYATYLAQKGIPKLYDWQAKACKAYSTINPPNLKRMLFSMPTSAGKTLVAELAMLKILKTNVLSVILALPFVALVEEKAVDFEALGALLGFEVKIYAGHRGSFPPQVGRKPTVFVATFEKANSIVDALVEERKIDKIGLVVFDELHMLGDSQRGANLEVMLTKVVAYESMEIMGISATISNLDEIAGFLKAQTFCQTDFRPVELKERIKSGNALLELQPNGDWVNIKKLDIAPENAVSYFVQETHPEQCLVFCHSKAKCETEAAQLAECIVETDGSDEFRRTRQARREELLKLMTGESEGLCEILQAGILRGIAYHHADLTAEERHYIEQAYSSGVITCLCCTTTLAAGVNLPAKRVIIAGAPGWGETKGKIMPVSTASAYRQICGRAGRAGLTTSGDSVLILPTVKCSSEAKRAEQLAKQLDEVKKNTVIRKVERSISKLDALECKTIRSTTLALIATRTATCPAAIKEWYRGTLFGIQNPETPNPGDKADGDADAVPAASRTAAHKPLKARTKKSVDTYVDAALALLQKQALIAIVENEGMLVATPVGMAAHKSSVDVDRAMYFNDMIETQCKNLRANSELHLFWIVTPIDMVEYFCPTKDAESKKPQWRRLWRNYYGLIKYLKEGDGTTSNPAFEVAEQLGVGWAFAEEKVEGNHPDEETPVLCARKGTSTTSCKHLVTKDFAAIRFYLAYCLTLLAGADAMTAWRLEKKYYVPRKTLGDLLDKAAGLAFSLTSFAKELASSSHSMSHMANVLPGLAKRLSHGVPTELVPLMEIRGVKSGVARELAAAGFGTLEKLAAATAAVLLHKCEHLIITTVAESIISKARAKLEHYELLREAGWA